MNQRNERIRDAFQDDSATPSWNTDRVLAGVLAQARETRFGRWYRRIGIGVASVLVVVMTYAVSRAGPGVSGPGIKFSLPLDSAPNSPSEAVVPTQPQEGGGTLLKPETPSNLIPLLGHRSSLTMDLRNYMERRDEYSQSLRMNPSAERAQEIRGQIAIIDGEIAAARTALRAVDNQIATMSGATPVAVEMPPPPYENVTITTDPPIFVNRPFYTDPAMIPAGISAVAMVMMVAVLYFFRRTMRATAEMLSTFQVNASSQLSAMTSGIEAVAIEVERLGENQRFMSKVIGERAEEVRGS